MRSGGLPTGTPGRTVRSFLLALVAVITLVGVAGFFGWPRREPAASRLHLGRTYERAAGRALALALGQIRPAPSSTATELPSQTFAEFIKQRLERKCGAAPSEIVFTPFSVGTPGFAIHYWYKGKPEPHAGCQRREPIAFVTIEGEVLGEGFGIDDPWLADFWSGARP